LPSSRRRKTSTRPARNAIAPLSLALLLQTGAAGCARTPEESVLAQFFAASRLRDRTVLGAIATVIFEPATDGIVTGFRIAEATPERHDPWASPESAAASLLLELSLAPREPGLDPPRYVAERRERGEALSIVSKDVTIQATVRPFEGATVERRLVITLQRVVVEGGSESVVGRWIVTAVREGPAAAAGPPGRAFERIVRLQR
jgi:hypothetical protein